MPIAYPPRLRLNEPMDITISPVDISRWDDLVELFGPNGATRGCWCMARRRSGAEPSAGNAENRAAMHTLIATAQPVGLLGYVTGQPVVWCAVAPRSAYQAIMRSKTLPIDAPDDETIWAVNCFFVKRGYRRRGLTDPMIEAAADYARESGARILEAYPVANPPGDYSRGLLGMFLATGFSIYAQDRTTSKRNVVVRRQLSD